MTDLSNGVSHMSAEIAEAPDIVAKLLQRDRPFDDAASIIAGQDRPLIVLCGRGSSGHVTVYLRYLIETMIGRPVSYIAPSVVTLDRGTLDLAGTTFIAVSQSGGSPDLVACAEMARRQGASTIAVVNDTNSALARACALVVPIGAGPELAVGATKTVIASMAVGAALISQIVGDESMRAALQRLPARLYGALKLDWSSASRGLANARCFFVASRGAGLGPAREIALKTCEILRMPAQAYSSAEILHGPRAALTSDTPVLAMTGTDAAGHSTKSVAVDLAQNGIPVFTCGPGGSLPWLTDDHPLIDPIIQLIPAYLMIERECRRQGWDPDRPPHLKKVTETL